MAGIHIMLKVVTVNLFYVVCIIMYIIRGNNLYTEAECEPTLSEDSNLVNLLDTVQGIQQIDSGK